MQRISIQPYKRRESCLIYNMDESCKCNAIWINLITKKTNTVWLLLYGIINVVKFIEIESKQKASGDF